MNDDQIKQKIADFLERNEMTVIATTDGDKNSPESALVGFVSTKSLELIFGTSNKSRKYANLQKNSHVAFVIGFSSQTGSVQYEGVAEEISSQDLEEYRLLLIQKNENNKQSIAKEDHRLFKVKPTWIRFLDTSGNAPGKYELDF